MGSRRLAGVVIAAILVSASTALGGHFYPWEIYVWVWVTVIFAHGWWRASR